MNSTNPTDDSWKDAFVTRPKITLAEFNSLPDEQKTWLVSYKHVFYQLNGSDFLNLLHRDNRALRVKLKGKN